MRQSVWAVVPAKSIARAKTRLAGWLTREERVALCHAMLDDVLAALGAARGLAGILVVTQDRGLALRSQQAHAVVVEAPDEGLGPALEVGFHAAALRRARLALFVPGDVPLLDPATVERLLQCAATGCIVPAARDGGTNALLCDARLPVSFQFGPQSAATHLRLAADRGTPLAVRQEPRLSVDVDLASDLEGLDPLRLGSATAQWLARHRTNARVPLAAGGVP